MKRIGKTIKRRRRESKTDYKARLRLLRSPQTRLVIRKTNRYMLAQFVSSEVAQDKVIASASSAELLAEGWPKELAGSLKGLAAAYLTGAILVHKAKVKSAILDSGMHRNASGGRVYAVLKGVVDAGVQVPHGESILPKEKRLEENQKTREIFMKLKEKLVKHGRDRKQK